MISNNNIVGLCVLLLAGGCAATNRYASLPGDAPRSWMAGAEVRTDSSGNQFRLMHPSENSWKDGVCFRPEKVDVVDKAGEGRRELGISYVRAATGLINRADCLRMDFSTAETMTISSETKTGLPVAEDKLRSVIDFVSSFSRESLPLSDVCTGVVSGHWMEGLTLHDVAMIDATIAADGVVSYVGSFRKEVRDSRLGGRPFVVSFDAPLGPAYKEGAVLSNRVCSEIVE